MESSILLSVKKNLGLAPDYKAFDMDVVMFINTAFSTLNQLGVGPVTGFAITGEEEKWEDFNFVDETQMNRAKTYVYLRVRLIFDPPSTSYVINAFEKQLEELEWRLNAHREGTDWVPPVGVTG